MKTLSIYNQPFTVWSPLYDALFCGPVMDFQSSIDENHNHTSHSYKWEFNLPGFKKKHLKIEIANGLLNITGFKKEKSLFKRNTYAIKEFKRQIVLTADMDSNLINAHFKQSILHINIPKKKECITYRQIPVSGETTDSDKHSIQETTDKNWWTTLKSKIINSNNPAA